MGTWGATSQHDGQEGVPHMASNQANVPVEMIESDYPIRIERYGFVPDTGGAGKYRGGLSLVREYRMLADDIYFGVRSDKCLYPPHGLFGGRTGSPAANLLRTAQGETALPSMPMKPINLRNGDVYRHVMAGGGGFGNPFERDPERVRTDVIEGKVSRRQAREAYGVVLTGADEAHVVDVGATESLRSEVSAADVPVPGVAAPGSPIAQRR
jgi:N-methylhydantoinase B